MARGPQVGEPAPEFTLPSTRGEITLTSRLAGGDVLLVFYPGDDTPVCTSQLCDYRDNLAVFSELGVDVLAINTQDLPSHEAFAAKHGLPFPLLSDASGETCRAYGARGPFGMTRRALVLVGRDGRVKWRRTDFPLFRRSAEELSQDLAGLGSGG